MESGDGRLFFYSLLAFTHSLVTFVFSVLIIVDKSIKKK